MDLCFAHLAAIALWAISFRRFALKDFALAGPPFNPPKCPRATAAGFFVGVASVSLITFPIIEAAIWLTSLVSFFLERISRL